MLVLRPYSADDLDALYRICLVTGDVGADATALYNDPKLLGHIYAAPYGVLEPGNVFVAQDDDGVAGYVVGTHDTTTFDAQMERDWWPSLREHYAQPHDLKPKDEALIGAIRRPYSSPAELVAAYPAHIHMNLLPRLRGQRVGSRLLDLWIDQAKTAGVKGIHLGASASNSGGIAFWTRSGFAPLMEQPGVAWFGMQI